MSKNHHTHKRDNGNHAVAADNGDAAPVASVPFEKTPL